MSFASKHNKSTRIEWGINTDGFSYENVSSLEPNTTYQVYGCFVTKPHASYGEGACLILADRYISLPERWVETVKNIMNCPEDVADILAGKVGIRWRWGKTKDTGRDMYMIDFVDLN